MSAAHTPTPWRIAGSAAIRTDTGHPPNDGWIGSVHWRNRAANAEFIVRAANCHDDLVTALKILVQDVLQYEAWQRPCYALDIAVAALAKAEGRS